MENEKSAVEKVSGNTGVNVAANAAAILPQVFPALGALIGTTAVPLLSAVPFLLQTLASGRQAERIEGCIRKLTEDLALLRCDFARITDDQYQLAAECSLSILSTVNAAKLEFLRVAILNTLIDDTIAHGTAEALARLIRDISVQETELVLKLFVFSGIVILDRPVAATEDCYAVLQGTKEEYAIGGLIRLGLLYSLKPTFDSTRYEWSPLTAKFIALVRPLPGT